MPRFCFYVRDGVDIVDKDGVELTDAEAARGQAIVTAGEMLRDHGGKFWGGEVWQMRVTDDANRTLCRLNFSAEDGDEEDPAI